LFLSAASLMILTFSRNLDYETDVALWSNTVRQYPENSRARVNLGSAFIQRMRYNEGLPHLQESLRIERANASHFAERFPGSGQQVDKYLYYLSIRSVYAFARYNLGTAYLSSGKPDLAIENFTEALRFRPQYHSAHTSLGIALYMKGNQLEAFRFLRQAIDLKPDDSTSHTNLGAAFRLSGNAPEALKHLSEALRLKPNNPDAHYGMGLTLLQLGRHQESALHLREAARLNRARTARFENLMLP